MTVTRSELQAWLDTWNENHAAPSADSVVDFLGIELAEPEPETPVGQRRRSPDGVEVVKTDGVSALCWQRYAGVGKAWFSYDAIADWQIVTDAPEVPENIIEAVILTLAADDHEQRERGFTNYRTNAEALARAGLLAGTLPEAPVCDREHLPEGHVPITFNGWSDDDLRVAARVVGSGGLGASIRAELARRGEAS